MKPEDAEAIALFRFSLIAEAANPRTSSAERGLIVQGLASFAHAHPDGTMRTYSRGTLDRWVRAYRARGLDGLRPVARSDVGAVRRHPELAAEAAALRAELPARSAAAIADILWQRHKVRVAERTIRAHLRRRGLHRAALAAQPRAFGRYEAERPNERWITDVLVGPFVPHPRLAGSRRARLFLIVDDHSRPLVHGRWVAAEDTPGGQGVLRAAIARRGRLPVVGGAEGDPHGDGVPGRQPLPGRPRPGGPPGRVPLRPRGPLPPRRVRRRAPRRRGHAAGHRAPHPPRRPPGRPPRSRA